MTKSMDKKILVITNIPTPYRVPMFNELNRQLQSRGLKLKVIFGALTYSHRKWLVDMTECEFEYLVLNSNRIQYLDMEKISFTYPKLSRLITDEKPSLIISNGFSFATTKLWLRSFIRKTDFLIWSGATTTNGRIGRLFRIVHRKLLIKRAIGFIAYGTKAMEYLVSLGAERNRIEIAINCVDTRFYADQCNKYHRAMLPDDGKKHLLYVGHLSPRKNVKKVLQVVQLLEKSRSDLVLHVVGDGEERRWLEQYAQKNKISDIVIFHGFRQKNEIPKYLSRADCFLFQTDFDIWGLTLMEAMAAGVPCIASIHAGATSDLTKNEMTGFVVDFSDTKEVAQKVKWLLENPRAAAEIGRNGAEFIQANVTIEKSAAGFVSAISKGLETQSLGSSSS